MDEIPVAPPKGEITVRPKTAPETLPKEVPKVDTPKLDLPDAPHTPQVPNTPPSPQSPLDLSKLIPPIVGATTAAAGKLAADAMKPELAPNGVEKINKREWTEAEYKQWFDNLPKKNTPTSRDANLYEIKKTGKYNYTISGGGVKFDADGIEGKNILEAKFVGNPERSPYVEDSKFPDFLRERTDADTRREFERMGKIIRDQNNPLTFVRVITNTPKSVPYFEKIMKEYGVSGEIIVEK